MRCGSWLGRQSTAPSCRRRFCLPAAASLQTFWKILASFVASRDDMTALAPLHHRLAAWCVLLLWVQTSILTCCTILLPALPLLLIPSSLARGLFCNVAACCQAAWFGLAVFCLRCILRTHIFIHACDDKLENWGMQGDLLLISNHPTRLDWMFLWTLAAALGRLSGLKIVLKDNLRSAPGFGWAVQCFAYPFMCRRDREADLRVLRDVCGHSGGRGNLALLLFPEGTDLSKSNLETSQSFARKEGLQTYTQVLHPRTAGFVAAWEALHDVAKDLEVQPPVLVDVTMAYVAPACANLPDEGAVFVRGHIPHEVHIRLRRIGAPTASSASELCCRLFAEKEDLLNRFHAPADAGNGGHEKPDRRVFMAEGSAALEEVRGVKTRMCLSLLALIVLETCGFRPEFLFGSLANDMKRVQRMIEERSRQISESEEQHEDEVEGSERFDPGDIFAMIDNLYEHAHGSGSPVVREGFVASLKSFEDTLLSVSAARTHLKAASDPPGTVPQLEKRGLVTEEHIAMIRSCLKQLQEAESSRSLGHEATAFAHLLNFRLRNALSIRERARDMPSARDLNAAWCHRTLQRLQRQDDGSAKRPGQARLLRWAREPRLVHQNAWGFALLQMMGWLWSLLLLVLASACFVMLGKLTGGIDKVILQHARQHPSRQQHLRKER
ncbi:Lysocardiolipin acyltransferase 1 [Symbiodinium microadriaticum]|uniref:Lysocardiolipin acyltransferase 1 n=1 Tax=Symbiodinium microadriaticum TaxID=2951 RepID=A0A1Q9CLP2_SYMMI|nr:Lysocardiolipin acyltransferase 1 [Symbiodinium microadriaticum]